jgi:hypothetical protein
MKKTLFVILSMMILVGCQHETASSKTNNSASPNRNSMPSNEEVQFADLTWFAPGSFESLKDKVGLEIEKTDDRVTQTKLKEIFSHSVNYANWELFSADHKVVHYQYEDIDYFQNEGEHEIYYYDLAKFFSKQITYYSGDTYSIIMDYESNSIFLLKNHSVKKRIVGNYKFHKTLNLKELTFIGVYDNKLIFKDNKNIIYTVDANTMRLLDAMQLGDQELVGTEVSINSDTGLDEFYLYTIDDSKKIRKILMTTKEVVFQKNVDLIEGRIKQIFPDMDVLYIVSEQDTNDVIYITRQDDSAFLAALKHDEKGQALGRIDNIIYWEHNPKEIFYILYNKQNAIPVRKIQDTFDDVVIRDDE